jgi:hypothetical protein
VKKEKKEKKEKTEEKTEKKEKQKKKREREPKIVSPKKRAIKIESSSSGESDDEDNLSGDEDCGEDCGEIDDKMEMDVEDDEEDVVEEVVVSPKNVKEEVAELLKGEDRETVIALAKEHEKAIRQKRQKEKSALKEMSSSDEKKLQTLFVRKETLEKSGDVVLLTKLKADRAALDRRIESQEDKSQVIEWKKTVKDIKAQRVHMRKTWGPAYKEKGFRYLVPNGVRQEKPAKKRIKDSSTCCICFDNETNCAIDCGHQLCFTCAQKVNECPQCRKRIANRIQLVNN